MAESQGRLDPNRLANVADAVIRAVAEIAAGVGAHPHPLQVAGTPAQPQCLQKFAVWEVEQACTFLARLGVLEAARPR